MSTVLKAVQELDRRGAPLTAADIQADDARRGASMALAGGALLLVLVGAVMARRVLREDSPPTIVAAPAAVAVAAPARVAGRAPQLPAASVIQAPSEVPSTVGASAGAVAVRPAEVAALPWGRIESPDADARPDAASAPRPDALVPQPKRVAVRRSPREIDERQSPRDIDAPPAPREIAVRPGPREISAPARPTSSGVPPIDVRAIVFADEVSARKVVLRIGNGPSVTLRQGESSDGIDVQVITENSVYMRHNGNIFSVGIGH